MSNVNFEEGKKVLFNFLSRASEVIKNVAIWAGHTVSSAATKLPSLAKIAETSSQFFSWIKTQSLHTGPAPLYAFTAASLAFSAIAYKTADNLEPGCCLTAWKVAGVLAFSTATVSLGFTLALFHA